MNRPDEAAEFERWLDRELPRAIATELDAPAPAALRGRSLGRRGIASRGLRGAAALVAVAVVVAGAAAVTTGSTNPASWEHQIVRAVTISALVLQRSPAPTPDPSPSGRPVTRATGTEARPQAAEGDTGSAGGDDASGNQGGAKPGHGDASPPPSQGAPPKDHGNQQGQNKHQ
jgi:hypothetical protein